MDFFSEEIDVLETFKNNVQLVGGTLVTLEEIESLDTEIKKRYPKAEKIIAHLTESNLGSISISKETIPHTLETID